MKSKKSQNVEIRPIGWEIGVQKKLTIIFIPRQLRYPDGSLGIASASSR
ncbi:MAG: hypothetical protein RIQ50_1799 [Bacteroidota bacterium]